MKKFLAALAVIAAPGLASAAAFQNGSFEVTSLPYTGTFYTLGIGSTAITGWTVSGGNIDYIGGLWQAADGSRSLDLAGSTLGTVSQTFDTVAGAKYSVVFALSSNNDSYGVSRNVRVTAGDETADYNYNTAHTFANMNWQDTTFQFTADASSTTLSFGALNQACCWGPALDNVRVTQIAAPVPEPETYAMMLAGLGLLGVAARRRRQAQHA